MIQPDRLLKAHGWKDGGQRPYLHRPIVGVDRPTAWPASWHRRGAIPWAGFAVMRAHEVAASSPAVVPLRTQDT